MVAVMMARVVEVVHFCIQLQLFLGSTTTLDCVRTPVLAEFLGNTDQLHWLTRLLSACL